ncbi:MAG: A/G-specific adenine glycosylase, partial [Bacteroidetes bacterium]|nr:A/G-specific adenine glycosylase [Bacteroidota bacterium]
MELSEALISWYLKNKRDLPWRNTQDAYKIWLSEIILQQTRVNQGLAYYYKFIENYPDILKLASANEDEVLKLWQGLGYYSRARNLLHAAKTVANENKGIFPDNYDDIRKLKGIGPYTAAAIASFAFKLPHAVVDGNVSRVLSRLFDVPEAINGTAGKKIINELAEKCLDTSRPDLHNQAMMELGAMVCTPSNPSCEACPVSHKCLALKEKTIAERPVKIKKAKAKSRYMDYAVLESDDRLLFRKRNEKDIWQGLHDFAAVEGVRDAPAEYITKSVQGEFPKMNLGATPVGPEKEYTHILSHRKIHARFWRYR